MRQRFLIIFCFLLMALPLIAQRPQYQKMSPQIRQIVRQQSPISRETGVFFVRITDEAEKVLNANGGHSLAQAGNIHIAAIPLNRLASLSNDHRVLRIEGKRLCEPLLDTTVTCIKAEPVLKGQNLPQAFTGKGVVMGVMDIGFDLTHPTFYSRDTTDYRIRAFWDMLSQDTIGSQLYVGRDYTNGDDIRALGCCRDGREQSHGTHTLGIAAGSGYNSYYRGMAPESDICIVANAVSSDTAYIDPKDYYKYTFATDALGFKYIFDYAKKVNKPCVISFSEGSTQDFWGYDQLFYEMLDSLVGPGRILVVAAGNQGHIKSWFRKPQGVYANGTFLYADKNMMVTCKSESPFSIRLVSYNGTSNDTILIPTSVILAQKDSILTKIIRRTDDYTLTMQAEAYTSCYEQAELCYDLTFVSNLTLGSTYPLSMEIIGDEADVEVYRVSGNFRTNSLNPSLQAGECTHDILSPGSAPCVICVGNNAYRTGFRNYANEWVTFDGTQNGFISPYSSVGPTYDNRIKPDVVAPGTNIISSYSSYYLEEHSNPSYLSWFVSLFDFNGRTYAWRAESGTSMACPMVAGAIALWLEAKPDLTREEIMGVLERTCRQPDTSLSYPNNVYGYGEIDVYAGLLDILGLNKIEAVSKHQSAAHFSIADGQMIITLTEETETPLRLRIYNISGRLIADRQLPAHQTSYSVFIGNLPHAIYAVQIDGAKEVQGSSLIRY